MTINIQNFVPIGPTGPSGDSDNLLDVNQTAHGFIPGQPVRKSGATWGAAQANAQSNLAWGLVDEVVDANNFVLRSGGLLTLTEGEWDAVGTSSGLDVGGKYWLQEAVAGLIQDGPPHPLDQLIVQGITSTQGLVMIDIQDTFEETEHSQTLHVQQKGLDDRVRQQVSAAASPLVLTNTSPAIQFIQGIGPPGIGIRDVLLPTVAFANPSFVLINIGQAIVEVFDGLVRVATIFPGKTAWLYSDTSDGLWFAAGDGQAIAPTGQLLTFAGNIGAGQFYNAGHSPGGTSSRPNADFPDTFYIADNSGVIDGICWASNDGAPQSVKVYINEVQQGDEVRYGGNTDVLRQHGFFRFATPIAVSGGDRVALNNIFGGSEAHFALRLKTQPAAGGDSWHLRWAGNPNSSAVFYEANKRSQDNITLTALDGRHEYALPGTGIIRSITFLSEAGGGSDGTPTGTDEIEIYKNGSFLVDITLTGITQTGGTGNAWFHKSGLSFGWVDGDRFAIRSKTNSDFGQASIYMQAEPDEGGEKHVYKGNPNSGNFLIHDEFAEGNGGVGITNNDGKAVACRNGRVYFTYVSETNPTFFTIFVNQIPTEIVGVAAATTDSIETNTWVKDGDTLQIRSDFGDGGRMVILLVVR